MESLEIVMWGMAGLSVLGVGVAIATDYIRGYRLLREIRTKVINTQEISREADKPLNELTDYNKL